MIFLFCCSESVLFLRPFRVAFRHGIHGYTVARAVNCLGFPHRGCGYLYPVYKVARHHVVALRLAQTEAGSSIRDLIASRKVAGLPIWLAAGSNR